MIRFRSAALACSLALTSVSVLAAASSSATFSNIQFQLTDLTPGDASQSGFSFVVPAAFSHYTTDGASGLSSNAANWGSTSSIGSDLMVLKDEAALFQSGNATAGYRVEASSMSVFGQAHGAETSYSVVMNNAGGGIKYPAEIEIAPHTELRVSMDVLVTASATNPESGWFFGSPIDYSMAGAEFSWSYFIPGQSIRVGGSDSLSTGAIAQGDTRILDRVDWVEGEDGQWQDLYVWHVQPGYEQVVSKSDTFQLVISNTSDSLATASLYLTLEVQGYGNTAPVSEPSGVLLMLSGLPLMAVAIRRRSRASMG